jgi:hypothetical protein
MPESFGKRQRSTAKAKKIAAREERRLERKQRDADRAAGLIEAGTPIEANEPDEFEVQPPTGATATATDTDTEAETDDPDDSSTEEKATEEKASETSDS